MLRSCVCTQRQMETPEFRVWAARMGDTRMHRKVWEWCFIAEALAERGWLGPGRRGLGFGVGQEPLPALFAGLGCEVLATDLGAGDESARAWMETGQHAGSAAGLRWSGICDAEVMRERVQFRVVDMRAMPDDLGLFDFVWSACSLEHLGSMALGMWFVVQSLRFLKPGGVAVHTTEYNTSSNGPTLESGPVVLYRRQDLEGLLGEVRRRGLRVEVPDWAVGDMPGDLAVERAPYRGTHLKLELGGFVATSFGMIIETYGQG